MKPPKWIERLKKPSKPECISYLAAGLYIISSLIPISGFSEFAFLVVIYFLYLRLIVHRNCRDERIRAQYVAIWIGYLLFFLYALVVMPFFLMLSEEAQMNAVSFLTRVPLDLLYVGFATLYLVILDRRAQQDKDDEENA